MSVEDVVTNIHRLNGETVTVAGYLDRCLGNDCVLYADEAHAKRTALWFQQLRAARIREERPSGDPLGAALGIGNGVGPEFDRNVTPLEHNYVLITGKITNRCRDKDGGVVCLDRSTDIEPTSIRAWDRSEGARG